LVAQGEVLEGKLLVATQGSGQRRSRWSSVLTMEPRLSPDQGRRINFEDLGRINGGGTTIVLVEQNVLRSLRLRPPATGSRNRRITLDGPG
jgi:hypothetical protein